MHKEAVIGEEKKIKGSVTTITIRQFRICWHDKRIWKWMGWVELMGG